MSRKKKRRKMQPGGGSKKGGSYERKLARSLSTWWYGEEGYLWRRPGSGHRVRMPHRHTGDIVPMADKELPDRWPFHIEAKCWSRGRLRLEFLLWPRRNPIRKIWVKAVNERRKDLVPLLILKANTTDPVAVIRERDGTKLLEILGIHGWSFPQYLKNFVSLSATGNRKSRVIAFRWEDIAVYRRESMRNFEPK